MNIARCVWNFTGKDLPRKQKFCLLFDFLFPAIMLLLFAYPEKASANNYIPSTKIGSAELVSPTVADSYYGSAVNSTVVVTVVPVEIQELGRSLRNDPDLIYDFVRNNIEIEWMYGSHKGPLGTVLDRRGSAFDQVRLLVELMRQAGFTATYHAGTVTLTGAQCEESRCRLPASVQWRDSGSHQRSNDGKLFLWFG